MFPSCNKIIKLAYYKFLIILNKFLTYFNYEELFKHEKFELSRLKKRNFFKIWKILNAAEIGQISQEQMIVALIHYTEMV